MVLVKGYVGKGTWGRVRGEGYVGKGTGEGYWGEGFVD